MIVAVVADCSSTNAGVGTCRKPKVTSASWLEEIIQPGALTDSDLVHCFFW